MVEPLAEVAQELVLPGLDLVPPNTVVPLETNTRFVAGLPRRPQHRDGARAVVARLPGGPLGRPTSIGSGTPPHRPAGRPTSTRSPHVGGRPLGDGGGRRELRDAGAQRAAPPLPGRDDLRDEPDAEERHPIFTGGFAPDVRYFGFDIGVDDIGGWSIVIQEHPSAPRFGIEVGTDTGDGHPRAAARSENAALVAHAAPARCRCASPSPHSSWG